MANISNETKKRVEFLMRELTAQATVTEAVFRCMGDGILGGGAWLSATQTERERMFVEALEATLDALNYIVKRIWPAE